MRTLAIVQSKGGTGKTTIALNLMAAAAEAGLSVALIDADYHAAGSTVLVGFTPPEQSLFAVLRENVHPLAIVQPVGMLSAVVLPGSFALSDLPADLPLNALADCIAAMREGHTTTATLPPTWSLLTVRAVMSPWRARRSMPPIRS